MRLLSLEKAMEPLGFGDINETVARIAPSQHRTNRLTKVNMMRTIQLILPTRGLRDAQGVVDGGGYVFGAL